MQFIEGDRERPLTDHQKRRLLILDPENLFVESPKQLGKITGSPYNMDEDEFEWDAAKAEGNLAKHGVSFEAARYVFDDVFAYDLCDFYSDPTEIRYQITGTVQDLVLTVVYTERGSRIRMISARKATTHEQRDYYRSQTAE